MKSNHKWPRHYAAEITGMKTRKERNEALQEVPDHLRDWVKKYVEIAFALKKKQG